MTTPTTETAPITVSIPADQLADQATFNELFSGIQVGSVGSRDNLNALADATELTDGTSLHARAEDEALGVLDADDPDEMLRAAKKRYEAVAEEMGGLTLFDVKVANDGSIDGISKRTLLARDAKAYERDLAVQSRVPS